MNIKQPKLLEKRRMVSHFGFSRLPFYKGILAKDMFDSQSQRELRHGLALWTEVRGLALVNGQSGVGKSITLRHFVRELPSRNFYIVDLAHLRTTVTGFLRLLNRTLGLPMRQHAADLFDAAQKHLIGYEAENGPHPIIVIDDAEGLSISILDVVRRLTCYEMDAQNRFSIILASTEDLLRKLRDPELEPLRSRIVFASTLRPFSLEDTQNYVRFHLERAESNTGLFSDDAVKRLFHIGQGKPRQINQLAMQALIQAAVMGRDQIDGQFMQTMIQAHPLYQSVIEV